MVEAACLGVGRGGGMAEAGRLGVRRGGGMVEAACLEVERGGGNGKRGLFGGDPVDKRGILPL